MCNSNSVDNEKDVDISVGDPDNGIRTYQGSSGPDKPAMNTFSVNPNTTYGHIENLLSPIEYYYLGGFTQGEPIYNGGTPVVRTSLTNNNSTCTLPPNPIISGSVTPQHAVNEYYTKRNTYEGILYTYFQNIDNGNTDSVLQAINLTFPSQAQQMRDDLMAQSPYVSTSALEAAANSGVLTDPLLLEVCLANPDATQSEGFLDLLEFNIPNPLPSTMIQTIYQSWGNQTARTILENQLAESNAELGRLSNQIIQFYKLDSLSHHDSIVNMLESHENKDSDYELVDIAIADGDFVKADQLMAAIDTNYTLTTEEQSEHNNLVSYIDFRESLNNLGKSYLELDTNELNTLRNIANMHSGSASNYARNILCFGYQECEDPPSQLIESGNKRFYDFDKKQITGDFPTTSISIQPNPASNQINVRLGYDLSPKLFWIELYDMKGMQVLREQITGEVSNVNIENLVNGTYVYRIQENGIESNNENRLMEEGKIIIQH